MTCTGAILAGARRRRNDHIGSRPPSRPGHRTAPDRTGPPVAGARPHRAAGGSPDPARPRVGHPYHCGRLARQHGCLSTGAPARAEVRSSACRTSVEPIAGDRRRARWPRCAPRCSSIFALVAPVLANEGPTRLYRRDRLAADGHARRRRSRSRSATGTTRARPPSHVSVVDRRDGPRDGRRRQHELEEGRRPPLVDDARPPGPTRSRSRRTSRDKFSDTLDGGTVTITVPPPPTPTPSRPRRPSRPRSRPRSRRPTPTPDRRRPDLGSDAATDRRPDRRPDRDARWRTGARRRTGGDGRRARPARDRREQRCRRGRRRIGPAERRLAPATRPARAARRDGRRTGPGARPAAAGTTGGPGGAPGGGGDWAPAPATARATRRRSVAGGGPGMAAAPARRWRGRPASDRPARPSRVDRIRRSAGASS